MPPKLKSVRGIVIHLSASRFGDRDEIDKWHRARGWSSIGYHACILNGHRDYNSKYSHGLDGKIEPGRPEGQEGAHCLSKGMNDVSLGVCCIGTPGFPPNAILAGRHYVRRPYLTERQLDALIYWLGVNCKQYGLNPLGRFKRPADGKYTHVISQHSDHDAGKPYCASLFLGAVRDRVARDMGLKGK